MVLTFRLTCAVVGSVRKLNAFHHCVEQANIIEHDRKTALARLQQEVLPSFRSLLSKYKRASMAHNKILGLLSGASPSIERAPQTLLDCMTFLFAITVITVSLELIFCFVSVSFQSLCS